MTPNPSNGPSNGPKPAPHVGATEGQPISWGGCPIRTSFVCNVMSLSNSDEKMDESYTSEWDFSENTSGSASEGNIWGLTVYRTLHV